MTIRSGLNIWIQVRILNQCGSTKKFFSILLLYSSTPEAKFFFLFCCCNTAAAKSFLIFCCCSTSAAAASTNCFLGLLSEWCPACKPWRFLFFQPYLPCSGSGMIIPDPRIRIFPSKEWSILNPKFVSKLSEIWSWYFTHRSRGRKGTGSRIPDPDPQHCLFGAQMTDVP